MTFLWKCDVFDGRYHDIYVDAVEWKGRNWILQTFQYEEKTVSRHYTQIRNIEKGGE